MKGKYFIVAAAVIAALLVSTFWPRGITLTEAQSSAYQAGLGTYAAIPANSSQVSSRVASALNFFQARSGVNFSTTFRNRLIALETLSLTAGKPKIDAVADLLSDQLLETFGGLSDAQIQQIGPGWRSVPDAATSDRAQAVMISHKRIISLAEWEATAIEFRNGQTETSQTWRAVFAEDVYEELERRANLYAASVPTQWGSDRFSPLQIFLLSYSVVTLDHLNGSVTNLQSSMQGVSNYLASTYSINAPISGRKGYGVNGYMHSSPANLLFNETVANRILDRVEEVL